MQKLKDTEKELRYVVRYIKVSAFSIQELLICCWQHWLCMILGDQTEEALSSTALHRGSSGGEREGFLQADPLHRETEQWGEGADQSPGESSCRSGRGAAGEDTEGDSWAQEDWCWAGEAFSHWRPRPLRSGMEQKVTRPVMWDSIALEISQIWWIDFIKLSEWE